LIPKFASEVPQGCASFGIGTLASGCRENDRLERHPTGFRAEFPSKCLRQSIDDPIRIDTASCADLIDERITVDEPPREQRRIRNLLFKPEDRNVDVDKSRVDQRFFYRIDPVIGERYLIELRWIGRKEAAGDGMRDSTERVVAVRVPDIE
jgi:hypothetical protein